MHRTQCIINVLTSEQQQTVRAARSATGATRLRGERAISFGREVAIFRCNSDRDRGLCSGVIRMGPQFRVPGRIEGTPQPLCALSRAEASGFLP
jgi:hypothetical protein